MNPLNPAFGGGATETFLHPLVAVWMLIAIVLILTLPRDKVIGVFLLAFFTIPIQQVILVGSLHFPVVRVLILAGLVRTATQGGPTSDRRFPGGFNGLDKVILLWAVSAFVINSLQWMTLPAFIKLAGDFLDALGGYLVVRFLIPDGEAVRRTVKVLAVICVIYGTSMVIEQFTYQNVFGFLGVKQPEIREGHLRAEGVLGTLFGGAFGGVLIPLFIWLWTTGKSRMIAYAGLAGATATVVASHASTSLGAYGAGLLGLAFWPLRKQVRLFKWVLLVALIALHLIMNGPVWSLLEHIDLTGGSSGYHRYMLVDNCIRHFSDWWLLGYRSPGDWGFDMWDLCNQFVAVAVTGGLISLVFYIMIYSRSFAAIGNALKEINGNREQEFLLWCLGSILFANVVASFGINYMIQLLMLLFPLLACISVATSELHRVSVQVAETTQNVRFTPFRGVAGANSPSIRIR
jgi:hypothetical protein